MAVYLVAITDPSEDIWEALKTAYDRHHLVTDTLALILVDDEDTGGAVRPRDVRDKLGIQPAHRPSGIVARLAVDGSSGVLPADTVNWLRQALIG